MLELRERGPGEASTLEWQAGADAGDLLVARLAKAEQLTIELSTFLRENFFDQFSISDVSGLPSNSPSLADQGRHPMITPSRRLTFVHAVRKPLGIPQGGLVSRRMPGDTIAILEPTPTLLGVDSASTAQVDVTAEWKERRDDKLAETVVAQIQSVLVHRGESAFAGKLQQEFGDTRYRLITYTVAAVSRFRQYFDDQESPEAFINKATLVEPVEILSTVRPSPPVVLAAYPSFSWTQEHDASHKMIRRKRSGGHVRIELERPWYQTGDGERLAVVVSTDGRPPEEFSPFISQVGKDPIWNTTSPLRWTTREMLSATVSEGDHEEVARLEELGEEVNLVTYEPWFQDGRWYVDVVMPSLAASSYSPLVQLVVGRYQPRSLVDEALTPALDLRLSRTTKTEFVSLLPDRTLTVSRRDSEIEVLLQGLGPLGPRQNEVEVILEHIDLPDTVSASLVSLTTFDDGPEIPMAWRAVPGEVVRGHLGSTINVDVPSGEGQFRVRVREIELIGSADEIREEQFGARRELAERTVFTDVVAISEL